MQSPAYRPDIDGLRAVAVLSVIFFHFGFQNFSGGFTGVDVFFVISGYLITNNIVTDLEKGTFTFSNFYLRRVRRLFPALFVTILVTFAYGFFIFPGSLLEPLGKSVVASVLSVSNILFWSEAGYFDADIDLKPLLHTWSLSVEEQFYFVWPALLVFLSSMRRAWIVPTFAVIAGALSLWAAQRCLNSDPSGAFFLAPFRITEFAIGALCVWFLRWRGGYGVLDEFLVFAGLLLIALPVATFSRSTPFPGISALVPTAGTALLICCGQAPFTGRLLRNRLLVAIGLISYSAYLVHWPLYVYVTYGRISPLRFEQQLILVFVTLALATLMYRFIELPFRRPALASRFHSNQMYATSCAALTFALVSAAGLDVYAGGLGWKSIKGGVAIDKQLEAIERRRYTTLKKVCRYQKDGHCNKISTGPNFLIIGDSHAHDALTSFFMAAPEYNYVLSSTGACPPLAQSDFAILKPGHPDREKCIALNQQRSDPAYLKQFDVIAINVLYEWYRPEHLARYLSVLREATHSRIFLFGGFISLNRDCGLVASDGGLSRCFAAENVKSYRPFEDELEVLAKKYDVTFISKSEVFCDRKPLSDCRTIVSGIPATADKHHLTFEFAREMGLWIRKRFGKSYELLHASPH
jgi:peptidoglycan/LPS O-acetylase OafA/YrhL